MVVAETLAGLALINSTVKGIKGVIGSAKDISTIAGDIDKLFRGKEEVKKKSHPLASKWNNFLTNTIGSTADRLSIGAIAKETIEEKLAEEQVRKVRRMVNQRFGLGTWEDILLERQHRLEQHKKEIDRQKKKKNEMTKKIYKALEIVGSIIFIIAGIFTAIYLITSNMKK
tara:strand:+ start:86 stop:598 length:513 start_codon:yes stop_codon:yes gene_type:complete